MLPNLVHCNRRKISSYDDKSSQGEKFGFQGVYEVVDYVLRILNKIDNPGYSFSAVSSVQQCASFFAACHRTRNIQITWTSTQALHTIKLPDPAIFNNLASGH